MTLTAPKTSATSIIIPTRNEATGITKFLDHLFTLIEMTENPKPEVILVDGNSEDETQKLARQYPLRLLESVPGRGQQLNVGAQAAKTDYLLFLHCDTQLPPNFQALIEQTLSQANIICGSFKLTIEAPEVGYRWIEKMAFWRAHYLGWVYGDQAIFMRRTDFEQINGFPDQPILEDFALIKQLRQIGHIVTLDTPIKTSARRWQKLGLTRTTLINQLMLLGYTLRIPPAHLARFYYQCR